MPSGSIIHLKTNTRGIEGGIFYGNPQITYFKAVYKKYTNFSIENIKINLKGEKNELNFNKELKLNGSIEKVGDLLMNMYLALKLPMIYSKSFLGHKNISKNNNPFKYETWRDTLEVNGEVVRYLKLEDIDETSPSHGKSFTYSI